MRTVLVVVLLLFVGAAIWVGSVSRTRPVAGPDFQGHPVVGRSATPDAEGAARVIAVRVVAENEPGPVVAVIDGKERRVAEQAWKAWLAEAGRAVLYSGTDGAGGFEDEGHSLYRYDVASGDRRKLLAADALIHEVTEARSRAGRLVYVVSLRDGAVGGPSTSILDPARGELHRQRDAAFDRAADGLVILSLYRQGAFDGPPPSPIGTVTLDLDRILSPRMNADEHG